MESITSSDILHAILITGGLLIGAILIVGVSMWGLYKVFRYKDNKFK